VPRLFAHGNESSRERKYQRTNIFVIEKRKFSGTKVPVTFSENGRTYVQTALDQLY